MKRTSVILISLTVLMAMLLTACGNPGGQGGNNPPENPVLYKVSYDANGAEGTAPAEQNCEAGNVITVAENPFTYEGFDFAGWLCGEALYEAGASYTVPETDTIFVAQWTEKEATEPQPAFTHSTYAYDRLGGGDLELPINLDGAGFVYLKIDGKILNGSNYQYNESRKVIVISEDYILSLPLGGITVTAITDAITEAPVSCTVTIEQSLKTSFDEETTKDFVYGLDDGVTFSVGYNGTIPKRLMQGDNEISSDYYTYDSESFTVKSEYLGLFSSTTEYTLVLSNNDAYSFSVITNVIFATDYDVVTEHNTTASNTGHNPLYQYYDNVSIVEGPEGMNGNVLKITPNTEEVTYDCNGYITLRASWWDSLWREVSFTKGKYYVVSFDYMTEDTSVGEFYVKGSSGTLKQDLLLGAENDGVLHHFSTIISTDELGNGISIRAKFIGGGGVVYIDNYKIAQLDAKPTIASNSEYSLKSGEDLSVAFDPAELSYEVFLNGKKVIATYNDSNKALIFPASEMEKLESGVYSLEIVTPAITLTSEIRVSDNRVSEFTTGTAVYHYSTDESVKVYGDFDPTLSLVSLKQIDKEYNDGYGENWDFSHGDTNKDYASLVSFVPSLDGAGYIEIPASVADLFWGETSFVAEFSNGLTGTFVFNSIEVPFFTNYEDSTIRGWYYPTGGWKDSPIESGMWGGAQFGVEERSEGNNAWYIRSTASATDACAFSIRMHSHPWEWYSVYGTEGNFYRVTFDYQISSDLSDVYFYVMSSYSEDQNANFFGDYDQFDDVSYDRYYKVRYNLIADGEVHTFDSGWFSYDSSLRMMKIQLPSFEAADGRFVMIDNYRITTSDKVSYLPSSLGDYAKGQADDYGFGLNGETVASVTLNGEALAYNVENGNLLLDKDILEAKDAGEYALVVVTDGGIYRKNIKVTDNRVANLTETSKNVVYGEASKLAGEFDTTLKVISLTRYGEDTVWDNGGNAVAMNPEYITIASDGLEISTGLINQAYKTGRYVVLLSNGKSVEFELTSNIYYYSNYDETNVYVDIAGNSVICQDSSMREFVTVDGNSMLKYTPANAKLWHSTQAIVGNGADNFFLTFENRTVNNYNWYDLYFSTGDTLIFTFDYEIVLGEGKESYFLFTWLDMNSVHHTTKLEGKGTYYVELPLSECKAFGINCPVASADLVVGSYMLVDNIGVGIVPPDTTYLTETEKNVVYGATESTLLAGSFPAGFTVTSLTRSGTNYWDNGKTTPVQMSTDYVALTANGLEVKPQLINMLYGTQNFCLTLSNGDTVSFKLTSNMLHYTNYDEVSIHEATEGNVESCQDTAMRQLLDDNGDKFIRFTPANATLSHSTGAIKGNGKANGIFTFSNTTKGNHWWWEYAIPAGSKIVVTFDYNIVTGEGLDSYFRFTWFESDSVQHGTVLTGSGTFTIELDSDNLTAFRIDCPTASADLVAGSYMDIDNFGFGIILE